MHLMYFYVLCSKMLARMQAAQNIGVLYVSGMYVACAVSLFVSYVEQISEKKNFS